jgi:hypothetical protein
MGVGGGVQRIEMTERETPVFGGAEFGAVGTYERLHGTVFGELDPTHRLNAGIVNLDRAARNAHGNVEYQSDFRILKPVDLERGNGCLVYDVPNRGNQPIMPRLNGAPDGGHPQHAGNGFLMRRGFTLVWSGWQGDVPPGADRLTAAFPPSPALPAWCARSSSPRPPGCSATTTSTSCPRSASSARWSIRLPTLPVRR